MVRSFCFGFLIMPAMALGQTEFGIKGGLNVSDIVMTNYVNPDVESDLALKAGLHAGFFVTGSLNERIGMAGDLVSNSLYYSMADSGDRKKTLIRGGLLGLGAGLGAVVLPRTLGLNEDATTRTLKTKVLTVTWYVLGGLVAAAAINLMDKKKIGGNFK